MSISTKENNAKTKILRRTIVMTSSERKLQVTLSLLLIADEKFQGISCLIENQKIGDLLNVFAYLKDRDPAVKKLKGITRPSREISNKVIEDRLALVTEILKTELQPVLQGQSWISVNYNPL